MFCRGLTPARIAEVCGAERGTVARHIRVQRANFPEMQADHEANRPAPSPKSLRASWIANIAELLAVLDAEGRYPTSSDPDPQRRRLGYWLSVQRRAQREGTLTQAKLAALDALPKWQQNQRRDLARKRWQERIGELQDFVLEHGRWPRYRNATSETERSLGVWLHAQRQKASRAVLSNADVEVLDSSLPGWYTWGRKSSDDAIFLKNYPATPPHFPVRADPEA